MILSRELGKRIWGGSTNTENGGGGVSSDYIAGLLAGYATETWVDEHYISIDFFSRLFQAHGTENGSEIDVMPNDMETTITSVESMFGFWTNLYISALGSNGAAPAGISLGMLTDVTISGTPSAGQVLTFDAATQKWVNANAQAGATSLANLTDVLLTTPQANQVMIYDATTQKWVNTNLKTINYQSIIGSGDISVGGGASGNYLPLTGGTVRTDSNLSSALKVNNGSQYKTSLCCSYGEGYGTFIGTSYTSGNRYILRCSNQTDFEGVGETLRFAVWCDGKVQVGTSSNLNTLSVYGTSTMTYNLFWNTSYSDYAGYVGRGSGSNDIELIAYTGKLTLGAGRHDDMVITSSHYFGFGILSPSFHYDFYHGSSSWALHLNANDQAYIYAAHGSNNYGLWVGTKSRSNSDYILDLINATGDGTGNSVFRVTAAGNCGIGTTSPSYTLHVAGTIYATGAITALSDARKKDITGEVGVTVEQIAHAPAIQFLWKDKERRKDGQQVGTLAQYWQTVLPEVVMDKGGELSMQYGVAALVSSIIIARKVANHEVRIGKMEKWMKKWAEENDE